MSSLSRASLRASRAALPSRRSAALVSSLSSVPRSVVCSSVPAFPFSSSVSSSSRRCFATQTAAQAAAAATARKDKLFDKILIANRGEIACRIIKTCRKLGIKTVAIYSDADAQSMHVKMADEAVCIGPAPTNQSYLNIPNILEACRKTGPQAVHPGYGFLSENKAFQESLQSMGIKFIGPGTKAITVMADKITSKKAAKAAGVNIIPGVLGSVGSDEEVLKIARGIGYPVMIKAAHGGGGKGMRIAWNDEDALTGFRLSKAEAITSFGDDTMFIEKFIEEPRHIEIQVLCDSHGNAVYLNERECTVQRRNQKVIEEAPSIFLDAATRKAMGEQAVSLAKSVGYENAGTTEFLVDKHRNFYYLEMNTRLQVEHPVTEAITGLDLVEQQIRVAAGHPLPFTQEQIPINGWAFESRVYAEDPLRGFLPSIGKLVRYEEPSGPNIRIDSGIREGSEISIYYDPMIAKLITYGKDRNEALGHMREALDKFVIRGLTHNVNFLRSLCDHPRFISGNFTTKFIPEEYPEGYKGAVLTLAEKQALAASAVLVYARLLKSQVSVSGQLKSFDGESQVQRLLKALHVTLGEESFEVSTERHDVSGHRQTLQLSVGGTPIEVSSDYERGDYVFISNVNGKEYTLQVFQLSDGSANISIIWAGTTFPVRVQTAAQHALNKFMPIPQKLDTSKCIVSPMPGAVYSLKVEVGDEVVPGQEVCVVEAMKMQNVLRATAPGKVKSVNVKKGQTVSADQVLVELE